MEVQRKFSRGYGVIDFTTFVAIICVLLAMAFAIVTIGFAAYNAKGFVYYNADRGASLFAQARTTETTFILIAMSGILFSGYLVINGVLDPLTPTFPLHTHWVFEAMVISFFTGGGVAAFASYYDTYFGIPLLFKVEMGTAITASILWLLGLTIAISGIVPAEINPTPEEQSRAAEDARRTRDRKQSFQDDRGLRTTTQTDREFEQSQQPIIRTR